MPRALALSILVLGAAVLLAGCVSGRSDYAQQCLSELRVPGEYEYDAGSIAPTVRPRDGGTLRGAELINSCIRRKAELAEPGQALPSSTATTTVRGSWLPVSTRGTVDPVALTTTVSTDRIYPAAPARLAPAYTAAPQVAEAPRPVPKYNQKPACRIQNRGVMQEPLFC